MNLYQPPECLQQILSQPISLWNCLACAIHARCYGVRSAANICSHICASIAGRSIWAAARMCSHHMTRCDICGNVCRLVTASPVPFSSDHHVCVSGSSWVRESSSSSACLQFATSYKHRVYSPSWWYDSPPSTTDAYC
jgi:hypothetical protein